MKLLPISSLEHKTNDWVWSKISFLVGPQEPLLATVKRRKRAWFGHVTRHDSLSTGLATPRTAEEMLDGQHQKREMSELLTRASCRKDLKRISAESSLMSLLMTQLVKGLV